MHPEYRDILIRRFTNQANIHLEPFYGIFGMLPGLFGPVLLMLPILFFGWRRADRSERRGPLGLFLIGFLGQVAIYTYFPSKRPQYLLPALPLAALALGYVIDRFRYEDRRLLVWTGLGLVVLVPVLALGWFAAAPLVADRLELPRERIAYASPIRAAILSLALAGFAIWIVVSHARGGRERTWRLAMVCWALGMTFLLGEVVPRFDSLKSLAPFARAVGERVPPEARLGSTSGDAGQEYYAGRRITLWKGRKFEEYLATEDDYLIVIGGGFDDVPKHLRRVVHTEPGIPRRPAAYLIRGGKVAGGDSDRSRDRTALVYPPATKARPIPGRMTACEPGF